VTPLKGQCLILGDDIDTDLIIPGRYLVSIDRAELAPHALEPLGPEIQERLRVSPIIVAGTNFGCGSAREQATTCLLGAGVKAVVAASFSRVFYRNSINTGLLAITSPEAAEAATDGSVLEVDSATGTVTVDGVAFSFVPYPPELMKIVEAGGLIPYVAAQLREESNA